MIKWFGCVITTYTLLLWKHAVPVCEHGRTMIAINQEESGWEVCDINNFNWMYVSKDTCGQTDNLVHSFKLNS